MENKKERKSCYNCKYLEHYYVKLTNRYFRTINGFCVHNKYADKDKRKKFPYIDACEFWVSEEELFTESKKNIEETIRNMENQLNDILNILKD